MLWVRTPLRQSVLDTTLCDKVCPWLAAGCRFSLGTLISSTNKTDCHDITKILLKVALNTINQFPFCSQWNIQVHLELKTIQISSTYYFTVFCLNFIFCKMIAFNNRPINEILGVLMFHSIKKQPSLILDFLLGIHQSVFTYDFLWKIVLPKKKGS